MWFVSILRLGSARAALGQLANDVIRRFCTSRCSHYCALALSDKPIIPEDSSSIIMGDKAGINRSLNNVRTELEYLRDSGVLAPPQFQSIMAQLPVRNTAIRP